MNMQTRTFREHDVLAITREKQKKKRDGIRKINHELSGDQSRDICYRKPFVSKP